MSTLTTPGRLGDHGARTTPVDHRPSRRRVTSRLTVGHVAPVVLAVVAAVLVLGALKDRSATELVATARRPIPAGQAVTAGQIRWVPVHTSDGAVAAGLLDQPSLAEGWVTTVGVPAGEPIALSELAHGASAGLGLGAMSLEVPVSRADGGAIVPGDRIDVISASSGSAAYVATALEVLTVGPSGAGGVLGSAGPGNYYVTVAVDRATALRLAAAVGASSAGGSGGIEVVRSTGEGGSAGRAPNGAGPSSPGVGTPSSSGAGQ